MSARKRSRKAVAEEKEENEAKRQKAIESGYGPDSDLCNAILVVEDNQLHVNKEVLMLSSPVFKQLFNGSFIETQSDPPTVTLPEKSLQSVLLLLDFLYHNKEVNITDEKAVTLLPLAHKYQIEILIRRCETVLREQQNTRLETLTLAEKYDLPTLLQETVTACAKRLTAWELHQQRELHVNQDLTDSAMLKVYKLKVNNSATLSSEIYRQMTILIKNYGSRDRDYSSSGRLSRTKWKGDLQLVIDKIQQNEFSKNKSGTFIW